MRRVAGRTIERVDRDGPGCTVRRDGLHPRIERRHRDRHVGRVRGDAVVAHAQHGVHPVDAAQRRAARPGHALVAGLGRVIEVGAPRALEQIPAGRGLVAKLRRRARQDRLRQQRIAAADAHVDGEGAVRDPRADAQAALRGLFDTGERQQADVDEMRRRLDLQLHEIDEVGAAGDELGRGLGCRCAGRRDAAGPFVAERLHVRPPSATSRIAATMLA